MAILTKEGYEKLNKELAKLKSEELPKASADLKEAISQGDISENAAYDEARDRKAEIEGRIKEIEKRLIEATAAEQGVAGGNINIGTTFSVRNEDSGIERDFSLVGPEDAMPSSGKVSFDSPFGRAFLGKNEGDSIIVKTPAGEKKYKVTKIY